MDISNETLGIIIIWTIIILSCIGIIVFIINPKLRLISRKFIPPTTAFFGTTHVFYEQEKREAIEHLNEVQADKKMEEDESGEPEEK